MQKEEWCSWEVSVLVDSAQGFSQSSSTHWVSSCREWVPGGSLASRAAAQSVCPTHKTAANSDPRAGGGQVWKEITLHLCFTECKQSSAWMWDGLYRLSAAPSGLLNLQISSQRLDNQSNNQIGAQWSWLVPLHSGFSQSAHLYLGMKDWKWCFLGCLSQIYN